MRRPSVSVALPADGPYSRTRRQCDPAARADTASQLFLRLDRRCVLDIWSSGHLVNWSFDGTIGEHAGHMSTFSEQLKERTMAFAESVLRLVDKLPHTPAGRVIANQLANAATSVPSNYRASCNARSRREFIAKLGVVVEEADESELWLTLIRRAAMLPDADVLPVWRE